MNSVENISQQKQWDCLKINVFTARPFLLFADSFASALLDVGRKAGMAKGLYRILVRFSIQSRQLRRQFWTEERFQLIGGPAINL